MTGRNGAARPLIVELVGPAGVGKSALAQRLLARPDVVRASVWNLPAALLIESAVRSLPLLLRLCVVTRALPREELKQIVRLNALRLFVGRRVGRAAVVRSEEHTSELQSQSNLVCRLLLEKKKNHIKNRQRVTYIASPGPGVEQLNA